MALVSSRNESLFCENQSSKMFWHVIRIAVDHTSRLPAHEMPNWVLAQPVDSIQVHSPLGAGLNLLFAHRMQWHTRSRIPDMIFFIDSPLPLPSGIPLCIIFVVIQVDGQIHIIPCGSNFKFTIEFDVLPVVTQEKLHHIAVPKF